MFVPAATTASKGMLTRAMREPIQKKELQCAHRVQQATTASRELPSPQNALQGTTAQSKALTVCFVRKAITAQKHLQSRYSALLGRTLLMVPVSVACVRLVTTAGLALSLLHLVWPDRTHSQEPRNALLARVATRARLAVLCLKNVPKELTLRLVFRFVETARLDSTVKRELQA